MFILRLGDGWICISLSQGPGPIKPQQYIVLHHKCLDRRTSLPQAQSDVLLILFILIHFYIFIFTDTSSSSASIQTNDDTCVPALHEVLKTSYVHVSIHLKEDRNCVPL